MRNRILRTAIGSVVLFAFMGFIYPAIRGQQLWNPPWLILSAIGSVLAALIADPLTQRRKRRKTEKKRSSQ